MKRNVSHNIAITTAVTLVALLAACKPAAVEPVTEIAEVEVPSEAEPTGPAKGTSGFIPTTRGWAVFDMAAWQALKPGKASCALDKVGGISSAKPSVPVKADDEVSFEGWLVNPKNQVPPDFAIVLHNDVAAYALGGQPGLVRPDVAKALRADGAMNAGYKLSSTLAGVEPGTYSLSLIQDSDGVPSRCDVGYKLEMAK